MTKVAAAPSGIHSAPFRLLLVASVLGIGGHSMLLPVVPLWAARGGSGTFGAGASTGVFMLVTVLTQLAVPWLVAMFAAAGPARYGAASAVWNITYDAGTGVGAVGLGAVAEPFGFRAAFGTAALVLLLILPVTFRRRSGGRGGRKAV